MTVLVTGATGFLGAQIAKDLVHQGIAVRATKRQQSKIPNLLKDLNIEWVSGDVCDYFSIEDALIGVDQVYHAAGKISFDPKDTQTIKETNVQGTANVVNACLSLGVKKMAHISSVSAIGYNIDNELRNEEDKFEYSPEMSTYSKSKYEGENEVWRGMAEGLEAVIVNPSIIIGTPDWNIGSGLFFKIIQQGNKFYTAGSNGFVDVQDVSACTIKLMQSEIKKQRFIINSENITYQDLFNIISDAMGKPRPYIEIPPALFSILCRLSSVWAWVNPNAHVLSKELEYAAVHQTGFSNKKLTTALNHTFIDIKSSIMQILLRSGLHKF